MKRASKEIIVELLAYLKFQNTNKSKPSTYSGTITTSTDHTNRRAQEVLNLQQTRKSTKNKTEAISVKIKHDNFTHTLCHEKSLVLASRP